MRALSARLPELSVVGPLGGSISSGAPIRPKRPRMRGYGKRELDFRKVQVGRRINR